ncbi:hypothetical protein CRU92_05090 [Arcobacter sp. FW59]|nr:hypothetical protein CRU92_05090 [Arcobacter sp. FW59]
MNKIVISENNFDFNIKNIEEILTSNKWGDSYRENSITKTFKGSSYFAIATIDKKEIGYIRAISDNFYVTFICEMIVHKDFQKKGVARELMKVFNEAYSNSCVYAMSFENSIDFFGKFGIKRRENLFSFSRNSL